MSHLKAVPQPNAIEDHRDECMDYMFSRTVSLEIVLEYAKRAVACHAARKDIDHWMQRLQDSIISAEAQTPRRNCEGENK